MQFPVQGGKITEFKMGFTLERVAKYLLFLMAFLFFIFFSINRYNNYTLHIIFLCNSNHAA